MKCMKCMKEFTSSKGLKYHSEKVDCLKNKSVDFDKKCCDKCGAIFTDRTGLYNHNKRNVCQKNHKKFKIALRNVTENKNNNPNTVINFINNGNIINININTVPPFLKYDTAEMINKFYPGAIEKAFDHIQTTTGLQKILKQTTFNIEHPIFNTVFMENKTDQYVKVSDGQRYINVPFQHIFRDIVCNKMNILKSELPKFKHLKSEKEYIDINEICDHYYYMYEYAPNFPEYDDDARDRLKIYDELIPELVDMCVKIGEQVKNDMWLKKLTEDIKIVEEFMNCNNLLQSNTHESLI